MKHVAVMRPDGSGAWLCAFPETLSEPAVKAHDQMIFDLGQEVESMRQQLAAALAAIKVKDEALDAVTKCIGAGKLRIFAAEVLALQPDDSALKAWLGKPVACRNDGRCQYAIDHGAEGLGHCPDGKCCMPLYSTKGWTK